MTLVDVSGPGRPGKARLFPDQVEAVERLVRHLHRPGTRGLFVSATGTGKTLVSVRVADGLGARLVLFVVPTLDLAAQTALAWRRDGHGEHMVIVSSLDIRGRDDLVAARVMSTTDPHALGGLMSVVGQDEDQIPALTVICTYDSLDKIEQTQSTAYEVPPFDLAIMDEAHRIAGRADKKWAIVNDAQRIRADRRLYMTATPRIFAAPELAESADATRPRRRPAAAKPDVDAFANSMDNEQVYGKKVVEYPLAQAVADGRAADYRIVVPTLTDTDLRRRLNLPTPGTAAPPGTARRGSRTTARCAPPPCTSRSCAR
ncbi:DEAD/DEAH box helicase family protein [Streptomyces sp. NPDC057239]|uniref:DEAD/DEAH box helicase family protein n=1 Tax=Streptomyces sp. NPDC057239 TaxID=3346061 RepID=UPI0036304C91